MRAESFSIRLLLGIIVLLELVALSGLTFGPSSIIISAFGLSHLGVLQGTGRISMFAMMYLFAGAPRVPALAAGLLASALTAVLFLPEPPEGLSSSQAGNVFLQIFGGAALLHVAWLYWRERGERRGWAARLLVGYGVAWLLSLVAPPLLVLTSSLHPATHDLMLYKLDASLGFSPSVVVGQWLQAAGGFNLLVNLVYNALPIALMALYGLQLRRPEVPPVRVLNIMVLGGAFVAAFAYHLLPITGPAYVFGSFPNEMPAPDQVPFSLAILDQAPRNGMPSMHFGWALAMWILARNESLAARLFFGSVLALTVVATLGKGEHYLLDLVLSWPAMLAIFAAASRELAWPGIRQKCLVWAAGMYLAWMVIFRFGVEFFVGWPLLIWVPVILTVAVCAVLFRQLNRANDTLATNPPAPVAEATAARGDIHWPVLGMFLLSGFAALMYQVLFSKQLAHVFGSMSAATNTVLATYMAGMALGAWLGGLVAPRLRRPLLAYAVCEFAIALYCAATPKVFDLIQGIYVGIAEGQTPDAPFLLPVRLALGGVGLLLPTVLMGMTLPLLARFFEQRKAALGTSVGRLYAVNTAGAALGALCAGYWIIPALGLWKTTLLAVAANLAVAMLGIRMQRTMIEETAAGPVPTPDLTRQPRRRLHAFTAFVVLTVGGFVTLALEVEYIHLLAVAVGNSTYAFSLMLFAFLVGLSAGGESARWLLGRYPAEKTLPLLELGLAAAVIVSTAGIDSIPEYFGWYADYTVVLGFGARELLRALVCCLIMIPPAFFIGAIFPTAIQILGAAHPQRAIRMLGIGSALNTVGNIAGVLVAGFILLPSIGALVSIQLMALICIALAAFALLTLGQWHNRLAWLALVGVSAGLAAQPRSLDYDVLTTGANVYFRAQQWGEVVDHAESLDGGLTTVNRATTADGSAVLTLLTNGKFQGNNSAGGEMVAQAGFALAPLMHVSARESALVIGYGTGHTAHTLKEAGFSQLDIAELSPDIYVLANRHFGDLNGRVTEQEGVQAYVTDGRNFLLLTRNRYDLISMEISSIWFAGAAALYSADYYRLAQARLKPEGVLQQWMQIHHASPMDILHVVGSVRAVFQYVWIYFIGGQAIIVASDADLSAVVEGNLQHLDKTTNLATLKAASGGSFRPVAEALLLAPSEVDRMLGSQVLPASYFVSNDDNMYLEYSTPRGNALDSEGSRSQNLAFLLQYSGRVQHFTRKD